jgi:hypothetical protein
MIVPKNAKSDKQINAYDFCDCLVDGQTITRLIESNRYIKFFHDKTRFLNRICDWAHYNIVFFRKYLKVVEFENWNHELLNQIKSESTSKNVVIISAGYTEVIFNFLARHNVQIDNIIVIANDFYRYKRVVRGKTKHQFLENIAVKNFYTDSYEDIGCLNYCEKFVVVNKFTEDSRFIPMRKLNGGRLEFIH